MKKILFVAAMLFVAGGASAQVSIPAGETENTVQPAVVATDSTVRERIWPDFHAVEIQGVMSVRLCVADAEHPVGVNFYTSDPGTGRYTREVENGVLKLKMQKAQSVDSVRVTVYYTKLDRINVDRAAVEVVGPLKAHLLDLKVSGGARFTATLDVADVALEVTGRSEVFLSGNTLYLDAVVSTALASLRKLEAMAVDVEASNKAEVSVCATDRIKMKSTTGALIRYSGNPAIERSTVPSLLSGTLERVDSTANNRR